MPVVVADVMRQRSLRSDESARHVIVEVTGTTHGGDVRGADAPKAGGASHIEAPANEVTGLLMVPSKGRRSVAGCHRNTLRPNSRHQQRDEALGAKLARAVRDREEVQSLGEPLLDHACSEPGLDHETATVEGQLTDVPSGVPATKRVARDHEIIRLIRGFAEAND